MEMNFEVILATDLMDGDVFYCNPDRENNDFGLYADLSGTDQIFIRDDLFDSYEDGSIEIAVNGGFVIWFGPKAKVVKLTHYSDLMRIMEMVKIGHPEMNIGPSDANTLISQMQEADPNSRINLLDNLDLDLNTDFLFTDDEDHPDHDIRDENLDDEDTDNRDLPF